jgi:hypothetical protein
MLPALNLQVSEAAAQLGALVGIKTLKLQPA